MSTPPITGGIQDKPPPGGYPKIRLNRGLPQRGPPGWAMWGGIFVCSALGFYSISRTNEKSRYNLHENREMRMAIYGYLRAEQDRINQTRYDEELAREKEIMKDRPDWELGKQIYHKKERWLPPTQFHKKESNLFGPFSR